MLICANTSGEKDYDDLDGIQGESSPHPGDIVHYWCCTMSQDEVKLDSQCRSTEGMM